MCTLLEAENSSTFEDPRKRDKENKFLSRAPASCSHVEWLTWNVDVFLGVFPVYFAIEPLNGQVMNRRIAAIWLFCVTIMGTVITPRPFQQATLSE